MSAVGQIERETQKRLIGLLTKRLGYTYLGDWEDREGNSNIEDDLVRAYLKSTGSVPEVIDRALHQLRSAAFDVSKSLYDRNQNVYQLLRYGAKVRPEQGEPTQTVWFINWDEPAANHFGVAEEVTIDPADPTSNTKRPDLVLYVNGVAIGVIELKRSTVFMSEGIRQNLDNQKKEFIEGFFSTFQLLMAGNDTEGLRYGTIETPEKYYLTWKEPLEGVANPLDRAVMQICSKERFLELIHDFTVFDAGIKKLCRHNQYFGVKAAQTAVQNRQGGIIWHTQGSGKSLIMVWLAKWIRENIDDARVLIITDRDELDKQIEKVFSGVKEVIYRARSGADLVHCLNTADKRLLCSLIHKFSVRNDDEISKEDLEKYVAELRSSLPKDFKAKGNIFVFVDEAHRTQSGDLHKAMKELLPDATLIGFTGTPLLRSDKARSIETFGPYIHTYKYDEAVRDGVVLDLRYEARDIDQRITSPEKIDQWFESKTAGLNSIAKAQLKKRWGTMQKVLSAKSRLEVIVQDILLDMNTRDRLISGHGNALLVSSSIYEACKYYELFSKTELKDKIAIVTSYQPSIADIKGEATGDGSTDALEKYAVYQQMLADWFNESPEKAVHRVEEFEDQAKARFIYEPGQLKLLIVVDKLLTGFDAPSATYLYIDKEMRDHGLFQAICRVNRLDNEKEYGYVVDYKDLFKSLEGAYHDYTSGAFDGYDPADVAGLLEDRLTKARQYLEDAREQVKALCEPVAPPKGTEAYIAYFISDENAGEERIKTDEKNRLTLYRLVSSFVRAYADLANEMLEAGFTAKQAVEIKADAVHFEAVRAEIKLASGDAPDLKAYEPGMRHLIDTYIKSDDSVKVSSFDDLSFVDLFIQNPNKAMEDLPPGLKASKAGSAAVIENNIRKVIVEETPVNPKYYEQMSELLAAIIKKREENALAYGDYLEQMAELAKKVRIPNSGNHPASINSPGKRALFDNCFPDEHIVSLVDSAIHGHAQDGWRASKPKRRQLANFIQEALVRDGQRIDDEVLKRVLELVMAQVEY
jgi:type I restriction enzyme R subunit